jgi:hypothetical protein
MSVNTSQLNPHNSFVSLTHGFSAMSPANIKRERREKEKEVGEVVRDTTLRGGGA